VAGAGSVWVGNLDDRNLTRIDSRRRTTVGTIELGNRTPTGLAVGAGSVWVAHGLRGQLSRVETEFGGRKTIAVTARPLGSLGSVALGAGYAWAAYGDSTLARILPRMVRVSGSVLSGASPAAVTVGRGAVWVANSGEATVQRFDPDTFEEGPIPPTFNVGRHPTALSYAEGALWVACRGDDVVERLDPRTNSLITIPVGDAPVALAVGAGAIWAANSGDGTISRIDPEKNRVVRTIDVGNAPAGLAFADDLVWVASEER
jgi:YVTN family beta-propeller protein